MEPKIGECSKHPGRSMIDCPACAIEEMKSEIVLKVPLERPKIEDFEQKNLMNGPYNQTRYAEHLNKYIDQLEESLRAIAEASKKENTILGNCIHSMSTNHLNETTK